MGCQIWASGNSINYSRGAWLVAEMCSPWFDTERDMDDPKYGQQCWVDYTSFIEADMCVPKTLVEYLVWRDKNNISHFERTHLDEYDFNTARDFITICAENKLTAALSH